MWNLEGTTSNIKTMETWNIATCGCCVFSIWRGGATRLSKRWREMKTILKVGIEFHNHTERLWRFLLSTSLIIIAAGLLKCSINHVLRRGNDGVIIDRLCLSCSDIHFVPVCVVQHPVFEFWHCFRNSAKYTWEFKPQFLTELTDCLCLLLLLC
jgi:hypothetical protein